MWGVQLREKWYCAACDHVAKSPRQPTCPTCREPMRFMGKDWRPGRRGSRTRMWDKREQGYRNHFDDLDYRLHDQHQLPLTERRRYPMPGRRVGRKRARAVREAQPSRPVPQHRFGYIRRRARVK